MSDTDSELDRLLDRSRRGEADAWAALVERLQGLIYSVPRRYRLDEDDAADVFMASFEALHRNLDRVQSGRALPGWLATTATRESLRLRRLKDKTTTDVPLEEVVAHEDSDAEQEAIRADDAFQVRGALSRMAPRCRDLLGALYAEEETAYAEVSVRFGSELRSARRGRVACRSFASRWRRRDFSDERSIKRGCGSLFRKTTMNCKAFEEGLAALAEGKVDSEAERHVATCPACATRLEGLRRVVAAARTPIAAAPRDLVARAQDLLRPSTRRLVARLLGNGFAASGARGGEATDFSLHVGVEEVSIRLHYAPTKGVWEILGRAPGEEWSVGETPCGPSGRFRLVVPSLESAAFVLRGPGVEIEVPSAWELLDRDA